jgi:hypothetical protein
MAVENLQGELQRVTRTIDLQESLVNGCENECGNAWEGKSPQIPAAITGQKNQPRINAKDANPISISCSFARIRG